MNTEKVINPSTNEVITEVPVATAQDIGLALDKARQAFDQGPWPKLSLTERKACLLKISEGILENAAGLARLETLNTGKPIKETTFMDVPSSAKTFAHFAHNLENYLSVDTLDITEIPAQCKLVYEPLGVIVIIVPWNYPLLIASWKLAAALAAGNTVILKPSILTPLTALELEKIIQKAGIPDGVVNVLMGSGASLGEALCSDKRVDMISFTGSNEVGKEIISYSAKNVKKMIMELGGKSASIILKDVDIEAVTNSVLCSIFLNQGQMCTAMSRIFVEDDIYDKFLNDFVEKTKRIKLGDGLSYETQVGPLISQAQRKKVIEYVERTKAQGAKLACGGKILEDASLKNGFFFEPTIFSEVRENMAIFQEEVFGPVTCVNKFSTIEEAVSLANKSDFALAANIWCKDISLAQSIATKLNAGIIWINTYGMFYNEAPYGGFKQSGFGKELGREGFLEYCRLKNIVMDKSGDGKPLVSHWYGF
jgi:betaine-aldehyde dehydrogenase